MARSKSRSRSRSRTRTRKSKSRITSVPTAGGGCTFYKTWTVKKKGGKKYTVKRRTSAKNSGKTKSQLKAMKRRCSRRALRAGVKYGRKQRVGKSRDGRSCTDKDYKVTCVINAKGVCKYYCHGKKTTPSKLRALLGEKKANRAMKSARDRRIRDRVSRGSAYLRGKKYHKGKKSFASQNSYMKFRAAAYELGLVDTSKPVTEQAKQVGKMYQSLSDADREKLKKAKSVAEAKKVAKDAGVTSSSGGGILSGLFGGGNGSKPAKPAPSKPSAPSAPAPVSFVPVAPSKPKSSKPHFGGAVDKESLEWLDDGWVNLQNQADVAKSNKAVLELLAKRSVALQKLETDVKQGATGGVPIKQVLTRGFGLFGFLADKLQAFLITFQKEWDKFTDMKGIFANMTAAQLFEVVDKEVEVEKVLNRVEGTTAFQTAYQAAVEKHMTDDYKLVFYK